MLIKYTFSLYWELVLLGDFGGCALLQKRHSYQEPSVPKGVPDSAPDVQSQNGDIQLIPASVLVPGVPDADNPVYWKNVTPTFAVTPTQPPSATHPSCQNIGQCNAYASVRTLISISPSFYIKSK